MSVWNVELSELRKFWAYVRMPESVARLKVLELDHGHIERMAQILRSYQAACARGHRSSRPHPSHQARGIGR